MKRTSLAIIAAILAVAAFSDDIPLDESFAGIGAVVAKCDCDDGYLMVMKVAKDSPAEAADIHSFDMIISIDGQSTSDMTLTESVRRLKGEADSIVQLEVSSKTNNNTRRIVALARQQFATPSSIKWKHEVLTTLTFPGTTNTYFTIEEREEDVQQGPWRNSLFAGLTRSPSGISLTVLR